MEVEKIFGKEHEGTWFPCQLGIHILRRVIESAQECGFHVEDSEWLDCEHEWHHELFIQAENWLNERAQDGWYFGHLEFDGSWGLWPNESEEDEEDEDEG